MFHRGRESYTTTPVPWYVLSDCKNLKGLQENFGFGSYQTAWAWLHKLRRAMVRPGRDRLKGLVEVDEPFVGGRETIRGRGAETKALVVIAVEKDGRRLGRTRMAVVADASRDTLCGFIRQNIEPGSTVRTDGWQGYRNLPHQGYRHDRAIQQQSAETPAELLPGVHRIASLLQRWLLGTHQGRVAPAQLPHYLDEFAFRFNRRKSATRGKLFFRLVEQAVATDHTPYHQLIQPNHKA